MSTPNTVISQLQSDLQRANDTTGLSDTTIHDAISSLILGYGSGDGVVVVPQTRKYQGEVIIEDNTGIEHSCNKTKYLFIAKAEGVPDVTNGAWYAKTIIGFYDANGIEFNGSIYNSISSGHRMKDGTNGTAVWCGTGSTSNLFKHQGNSFPVGVKCTWELYDLSDC